MLMRVLLLLLVIGFARPVLAGDVKGVILDVPSPIAPFALVDHKGNPFTLERLRGSWSLVFLGFTHCPDVCPFTLANLAAVRAELSQLVTPEKLPQIVFLAVDPDRDRDVLPQYVAHFDLAFIGVTGEREQIDSLTESLDAFYRLENQRRDDDAYDVTHSAAVSVVTPDGAVMAKLSPPFQPYDTASYLFRLIHGADTN